MSQSNQKTSEIEVQNKIADSYEHIRYGRLYSKRYQQWWTSKMLSFISPENMKGRILDNGCGIGNHFEEIDNGDRALDVCGLDIAENMIRKAAIRIPKTVLGDSQYLPFKESQFDVVFSRSLLHHLPQPSLSIEDIDRVLKENGEAVFADTNASFLSILPRKIVKKKGEHFSELHKNFKDKELLELISSKFQIDHVYYFGYIAYPLLGFPDVIDIFRFIPFKNFFLSTLIKIDEFFSMLPKLRTQSWGIIIKASQIKKSLK